MTLRCPKRTGEHVKRMGVWQQPRCNSTELHVLQRLCNHSAFNGYRYTPSAYSSVRCKTCGWHWRTKADVSDLPDATDEELGIDNGKD